MKTMNGDGQLIKQIGFVVLGTAIVLLMPLLAMQFTSEVDWKGGDFAIIAVLLVCTGLAYVFGARLVTTVKSRAILGAVLGLLVLLVWVELAVGVFGSPFAGS
ncbi:MAG: hypothetical protein V4631_21505 [Pseudomonadota bacterium]